MRDIFAFQIFAVLVVSSIKKDVLHLNICRSYFSFFQFTRKANNLKQNGYFKHNFKINYLQ